MFLWRRYAENVPAVERQRQERGRRLSSVHWPLLVEAPSRATIVFLAGVATLA
jgi:hypothetical protein